MKIGRKFALWIVLILLAVSVVAAYLFYVAKLREETGELDIFGRMAGRVIEESLITYMQRRDTAGLNKKLEDVQKSVGIVSGIMLLNKDGIVKAGTDKEQLGKKLSIHDVGCRECHEQGSKVPVMRDGSTYRWASPVKNKQECHACHLALAKNNGVLIIDFSIAEFQLNAKREILSAYVIFGLSLIVIGVVMVFLAKVLVTRRLERMGATMRDFQQGGTSALTPVEGHDEITHLETGFNEMVVSIQRRENEKEDLVRQLSAANDELLKEISLRTRGEVMLREQKKFTDNLIAYSAVATFVIDVDHKIVLWNKACEELTGFHAADMIGTSDQWKPFYPHKRQTLSDVVIDGNTESLSALYEKHARSNLTPDGLQAEGWYKSLNGKERYIIFDAAPIYDGGRNLIAVIETLQDITSSKRIEMALRESEDKFRQVVTSATDAILLFDVETRQFVEANRAAEEIYGYRREEWLNMRQDAIPVDKEAADAHIREIVSSKKPIIVPLRYHKKKDGTIFPVEIASSVFLTNGRQLVCEIIHDITDRKKTEEVIQRNYDTQSAINWILHISLEQISLESVLKQTLDLILAIPWLSFEAQGSIHLVEDDTNKLVMKVQRGLPDQLVEACAIVPFGKCLCGRAAARGEVQFADSLDDRHEIQYKGIVPHGHYCVPIMHAHNVLGVINMYLKEGHKRDEREIEFLSAIANALAGIIQRKSAEKEREKLIVDLQNVLNTVSRAHKEWRDTFDSITDMISIVDKDFTIVRANRAFSAYYGLQPQDVVNKKCYEFVHDGDSPIMNCPHQTTIVERKPSGEEVFDKRTNRLFHIFTFPYNSPEGEIIGSIHIMRDITDDKEKEMRLIMSERLAALGQMASGIAHEINNPLASIAGCSEGLLSRVKKGQCETALFESYLNIIQEEVFRCKNITTAMLSFVRKPTYEQKDINLTEALDKTIEIIGFQGRLKNIEVIKKYHEPTPIIRGNEGELRQVMLAVITNALDAMNDQGALTIETEVRAGDTVVRISDTGEGISPDIINRIFDPFFTTKSARGGTGLGLSIARKIVANHKGQIEASSSAGQGTTLTLTLPQ